VPGSGAQPPGTAAKSGVAKTAATGRSAGGAWRQRRRARSSAGVLRGFSPSTAGEDFSFRLAKVPSAYVPLGTGPGEDDCLHPNPRFDFSDGALAVGAMKGCGRRGVARGGRRACRPRVRTSAGGQPGPP